MKKTTILLRHLLVRKKQEFLFGLILLAFGLLFVCLTPPLRSPDEGGHFVRAYQFATQGTRAITEVSFTVPMRPSVTRGFNHWAEALNSHSGKNRQAYSIANFRQDDTPETIPRPTVDLAHPQAIMFPLAYIPQAVAIAVGNMFDASFLTLLYSARLMNLITCIAITLLSLHMMPAYGKSFLVAVSLLPMSVFIRSQMASDGLVIAAAGLVIASILQLHERPHQNNTALYIYTMGGLILLAACKSTYLVAFALWLLLLDRRLSWLIGIIIVTPALLLSAWWGHFLSLHDFTIHESDIATNQFRAGLLDPSAKYELLLHHPMDVIGRIASSLWRFIFDWTGQMIGIFGHMDIIFSLPLRFLGFFWLAGLVYALASSKPMLKKWQALWLVLVFWAQVILVLLTIFLIWADPMAHYIGGVQGRYFLPLLPLLLIGINQLLSVHTSMPPKHPKMVYVYFPAIFFLFCSVVTVFTGEWL